MYPGETHPGDPVPHKYVIVRRAGFVLPIVFDALLKHAEVVYGLTDPVVAAGFVTIGWDAKGPLVHVMGESVSLDRPSRIEDAVIIRDMLLNLPPRVN